MDPRTSYLVRYSAWQFSSGPRGLCGWTRSPAPFGSTRIVLVEERGPRFETTTSCSHLADDTVRGLSIGSSCDRRWNSRLLLRSRKRAAFVVPLRGFRRVRACQCDRGDRGNLRCLRRAPSNSEDERPRSRFVAVFGLTAVGMAQCRRRGRTSSNVTGGSPKARRPTASSQVGDPNYEGGDNGLMSGGGRRGVWRTCGSIPRTDPIRVWLFLAPPRDTQLICACRSMASTLKSLETT